MSFNKVDFPTAESHFIRKEQQSEKSATDTVFILITFSPRTLHCSLLRTVLISKSLNTLIYHELCNLEKNRHVRNSKRLYQNDDTNDIGLTQKWLTLLVKETEGANDLMKTKNSS